jgi:Arabinose-binding domain of AraC transcription regulator, N-term
MDRYVFAWTVTIGRRGTGRAINPSRVEFRRPEAQRRLYENYFACPVRFGARRNKLFFRAEDVSQPFVTHNPELLELVAPQLEAELKQQLAGSPLKEQAKGILKNSWPGRNRGLRTLLSSCESASGPYRGACSKKESHFTISSKKRAGRWRSTTYPSPRSS